MIPWFSGTLSLLIDQVTYSLKGDLSLHYYDGIFFLVLYESYLLSSPRIIWLLIHTVHTPTGYCRPKSRAGLQLFTYIMLAYN